VLELGGGASFVASLRVAHDGYPKELCYHQKNDTANLVMEQKQPSISDVTCPFCGLACDDLMLTRSNAGLEVKRNGCAISTAAFRELGRHDIANSAPRVAGKVTTLNQAVLAATKILSQAKAPLIAGLGTDIAGARAALELADRIGAVVDHMNMPAKIRNILTLQNAGWITTTLAEIKNRADFILVLGSGVLTRFPRFLERAVWSADAMFIADNAKRKVIFVGEVEAFKSNVPTSVTQLQCSHDSFTRIVPALRAMVNGQRIDNDRLAASDVRILQDLAASMKQANYGVIVWAAPDFDFPHGELLIQTLAEMIKDLNKTIRFAGFPLGGSDGDFSANATQTWQTGFPLRSRYGKHGLDYDPYRYGSAALLAEDQIDALLWISSFSAKRLPPQTKIPHIVLGPPSMAFEQEPDVFIPIATPGIHHDGHFVRADKVVVMPLKKLLKTALPSVAEIAERILDTLRH
jgi:formylmethanofuran dehydrogenase subunit B